MGSEPILHLEDSVASLGCHCFSGLRYTMRVANLALPTSQGLLGQDDLFQTAFPACAQAEWGLSSLGCLSPLGVSSIMALFTLHCS